MRFKTRLKSSPSLIDLTPLVDVVFLLLIFFIVTSDILPLKSLNISPPSLDKDSTPLTSHLIVVMDAQQVIYVGSKKAIVDLSSLQEMLTNELSLIKQHQEAEPTIVLSIDRQVDYGAFLKIFNIAQETGEKIRLVYQYEES